jgi:hypothetical protein
VFSLGKAPFLAAVMGHAPVRALAAERLAEAAPAD